jgi:four helix bundle protein
MCCGGCFEQRAEGMEQRAEDKRSSRQMAKFRFQDLRIWQLAIEIADKLFDIADKLEQMRLYRFAEQLRGAAMSMSNNISEGSGSSSNREFAQFLNIARRSTFENANISIILNRRKIITDKELDELLSDLDSLCRQISSLKSTLN